MIIGVDECGLGSWAGPLCVVGAIVSDDWRAIGVRDSKKMTPKERETIYELYRNKIQHYTVLVESTEIDRAGIAFALGKAHADVVLHLHSLEPQSRIVLDGVVSPTSRILLAHLNVEWIPKADDTVPAVSIASVFAKVTRDRIMRALAATYPGYTFEKNVGYGTEDHARALRALGPCHIHRKSYAPVAQEILRRSRFDLTSDAGVS
jgi:ribonuclease HII